MSRKGQRNPGPSSTYAILARACIYAKGELALDLQAQPVALTG